MKKIGFILGLLFNALLAFSQSTVNTFTFSRGFVSLDPQQIYQGLRIAAPTMTLANSMTTYTYSKPFNNSDWQQVYEAARGLGDAISTNSLNSWNITGNAISTNTNFIGTTTNRSLLFKTNDSIRVKIDSLGALNWSAPSVGYVNNFSVRRWGQFPQIPAIYLGTSFTNTNYFAIADGYNTVVNAPANFVIRGGTQDRYSAGSTDALTLGGSFNTFFGTNTPSLAATRQLSNLLLAGFNVGYQNGTTATTSNLLINPVTHSANTTATISEACGLRVLAPIQGAGMTISRNWAIKCEGSANITNSLMIANATGTPQANLDVQGTLRIATTATIGSNLTVSGTTSITGTSTLSGNLVLNTGNRIIQGSNLLTVDGIGGVNIDVNTSNKLSVTSTSMLVSNQMSVTSTSTLTGLRNNGTFTTTSTAMIGGTSAGSATLHVLGTASVSGTSTLTNIVNNGTLTVSGTSTLNGLNLASGSMTVASKGINTTAGDAATINSPIGRFRKDNTGATFTLTNSFITANSIIVLTAANAAIDATATNWTISAGSGSATITFNAAPTANFDMNFILLN